MSFIATYDSKIFYNPGNRYCVIRVKSADTSIPEKARSAGRYKDHLIRFTAVGYRLLDWQIKNKVQRDVLSILAYSRLCL